MIKNIVLIGMPGCGKTSLGKRIGEKLHRPFIDMDSYIELHENKSIKEMFAISEKYFRDVESKYTIILGKLEGHIIATGGGLVKRKENTEILKKSSLIIFINRPLENIVNDIDVKTRPLLKEGTDALYKLYSERIHLYKKYCDVEILNDSTIDNATDLIIEKVSTFSEL